MSEESQGGQDAKSPEQSSEYILQKETIPDLPALDLGIGDALQLQESSAPNQRYFAKLIGYLNRASVVIHHPMQDEKLLAVENGQVFLVRGFSGRKTYEFNAEVLSVSYIPYPLLHLAFPKQIDCMTMRRALRVKPNLAGWIGSRDTASVPNRIPMIIVDISTSGARVHAKRQFGRLGEVVNVACRLPVDGEEQDFSIAAVIRNSYNEKLTESRGGVDVVTFGLEFIQPQGRERMALQNYIYATMAAIEA
jgi:c-di-GMP-binding flagellar brake protein YcgR